MGSTIVVAITMTKYTRPQCPPDQAAANGASSTFEPHRFSTSA